MIYSGSEKFIFDDADIGSTVNDFWSWAFSDFESGALRGTLAEYIVAQAINAEKAFEVTNQWAPYDLNYNGKRIEVKCAGTIQRWGYNKTPNIIYKIAPATLPDASGDYKDGAPKQRNNDVYVFCLFNADNEKTSPLNLNNWSFYVLSTKVLDEKVPEQKTISLTSLKALGAIGCDFCTLKNVIDKSIQ